MTSCKLPFQVLKLASAADREVNDKQALHPDFLPRSFMSQGSHGIYTRRAIRGDVGREQGGCAEHESSPGKGSRIKRADMEQLG